MDISKLNKDQKKAVLANQGPVMVLAGAGSGKTRTLVTKIAYLLEEKGLSPFQLLALTFSNKAAREMRDRISSLVSEELGALQVTTFHAFCAKVLRSEAHYLGLSRSFTIYDTAESKTVVKSILQRNGISTKEISPFEILYFINEIKNNGFYQGREAGDFEPDREDLFYSFYQQYEAEIHRANAVDFGGLVTGVIQLFEKFPEVLERYQGRFKYVLVDEYQDTNRAQFELVRLISEKCKNICVVGDEDQSIYSWRGANISNILDFEKIFPETQILKLEQNYRSSKIIIEAAGHVIARNTMRKGKQMWTRNNEGEVIEIVECHNDKKEAEWITLEILELNEKKGVEYRDIAVFYRANFQSRLLEDALRKIRIPYRVIGGIKFYERKEIKDLLAYMRLVVNIKDSLALSRIINVPARGIGTTTLRKLEGEAIRNNFSLFEICEVILENEETYVDLRLSAKVKSSLRHLIGLINDIKILDKQKIAPSVLYEKILHESGYYGLLKASKDYESIARIENLEELGNAISQYEESMTSPNLVGFLETITLDSQNESEGVDNQGDVSLMTIHGSKGLEFSYVFVTGVEENVFPSYKSLEMGSHAEEEERRLFYVAMTRAMERLYLTFAQGRMLFGQLKFNGPSRFLHEIPNKYYHWKKINDANFVGTKQDWGHNNEWVDEFVSQESPYEEGDVIYQVPTEVEDHKVNVKFPRGTRVIHSLYGEGLVLESEGIGAEEKVVIKFNDGARKKFMVKFAPLVLV